MERTIERAAIKSRIDKADLVARGRLDARSLLAAALGAIGFWLLAVVSLSLSRFDSTLASIWLPNACAVAFLLRARIGNELPFYAAILVASVISNTMSGTPLQVSSLFSVANLLDILVVTSLTRRFCGPSPDMSKLDHLARFVWAGGLVGPILSASLAAIAMGPDDAGIWSGAIAWFLTDSMGMVLIVPTVLLVLDAIRQRGPIDRSALLERTALLLFGLACAFLVFRQADYPLLFLIPPITLLHAFRSGSLGTALFVGLVAIVVSGMSWMGLGPIAAASESEVNRLHLIQAFIAANFLTGLPVAAILTGRDRIMEELDARRRELALLAENTTDALMCFDLDGVCTYASPSVAKVLAEPTETFIGKRPSDRMHEDASERIVLAQNRLTSGESDQERFTYRRYHDSPEGTPVFLEAECAVAYNRETGEREGIVVSARDVTERVELELLLTRARRHAENAARAKSEFLANMSHEIRTPMNGVLGFAELMLRGELDEEQQRHASMIVESGRSMMLLLNDILDLSKIEAGQIAIDHAAVDLDATIRECAALHRPSAEKKGLELHVERAFADEGERGEATPWVTTDGLRLRQILLNLVGNAVKFTENGHIHVSYQVEEDRFCIRVADTGIGISRSRLDLIFKPFMQGENDTARRFGGTGLGLSISRQLAELLGGYITVDSEPGVGSCFSLTLPATRALPGGEPDHDREPTDLPIDPGAFPQSAKILLAEDNDVNRELVVEMLERCGQSVEIAGDGNEAISLVIDGFVRDKPYDLVLMDIQMPGCDGYAATRAIRAEGIRANTLPIIALTANAFPEDIAAAREAGMQAHLAKPLDFAALARTLQRWLPTRIVMDESGARSADSSRKRDNPTDSDDDDACDEPQSSPEQPRQFAKSPSLARRWNERRRETVEAVRNAVEGGLLAEPAEHTAEREELAQMLHKIAGTAAMFDEAELGDQAATLEHALRRAYSSEAQQALAKQLLDLADQAEEQPERVGGVDR